MEITVYVEPLQSGFRASTTNPLAISADGPSESSAVESLTGIIREKLKSGGRFQTIRMTDADAAEIGRAHV